jgi:hypothetical protein
VLLIAYFSHPAARICAHRLLRQLRAAFLTACGLFPLLDVLLGLVPHPQYSLLLRQPQADNP